jgi:hypothetical protein
MNVRNIFAASLSLASLLALSTSAQAAYVPYTFTASGAVTGNAELIGLMGSLATASGQFVYNSAAPVLGQGGDLGYEPTVTIFAGTNSSNLPFASLAGLVAGKAFSDLYGTVAVGNSYQGGTSDVLSISSDPSPKVGLHPGRLHAEQRAPDLVGKHRLGQCPALAVAQLCRPHPV